MFSCFLQCASMFFFFFNSSWTWQLELVYVPSSKYRCHCQVCALRHHLPWQKSINQTINFLKSLQQLVQIYCPCRSSRWAGCKSCLPALLFHPPLFSHISVLLCPLIRQTVTSVQGGWSHSVTPHASTYRGRDYNSLYASAPNLWQN